MSTLNKDSILAADDLQREEVPCPEWGGSVFVRIMTAGERDRLGAEDADGASPDARARLAVKLICDEAGALLFTPADIPALSAKNGRTLDRIVEAALRLNRMNPGDVEAAAGESSAVPSSASA